MAIVKNNEIVQKTKKICKKQVKNDNFLFKNGYFAYYDDVKDGTHKIYDW